MHAVYPHAHYLATEMEGRATLPDGTERWLIRIDDWDFNWQDVYRVREPYVLPAGTTPPMRFTYDNSAGNPRNPSDPPRRVRAGNRSSDEMAHLQLQVRPRRGRRSGAAARIALPARDPQEPGESLVVLRARERAVRAGARGRGGGAVPGGDSRPDPTHLASRNSLGAVRERQGRLEEAAAEFQAVVRLDPGFADGHFNLGSVRLAQGRMEQAASHYRETLSLEPDHAPAHTNLGHALRDLGRLDEAVPHHREALRLGPGSAEAHNNLGSALAVSGLLDEAMDHFQRALRIQPDHLQARRNWSWPAR